MILNSSCRYLYSEDEIISPTIHFAVFPKNFAERKKSVIRGHCHLYEFWYDTDEPSVMHPHIQISNFAARLGLTGGNERREFYDLLTTKILRNVPDELLNLGGPNYCESCEEFHY